jgi:hypothetical protein
MGGITDPHQARISLRYAAEFQVREKSHRFTFESWLRAIAMAPVVGGSPWWL